jgi:hypothetical protein
MLSMHRLKSFVVNWRGNRANAPTDEDRPDEDLDDKIKLQIQFSQASPPWNIIMISPDGTIGDLKQLILSMYKIPIEEQTLYRSSDHNGQLELYNHQNLKHYNLNANDVLFLKLKDKQREWIIYVKYKKGEVVAVPVSPSDSLDEVRIRIFGQDLLFKKSNGSYYALPLALTDLDIKNGDVIDVATDGHPKVDVQSTPLQTTHLIMLLSILCLNEIRENLR